MSYAPEPLSNDITIHGYPESSPVRQWLTSNFRKCPTCRGTGINPVWQSKVCPKCDGERYLKA